MELKTGPKQRENTFTVGFYNVENLFDTINDPETLDDDFTDSGKKKWTPKRYQKKLKKLSSVISQLGTERSKTPPVFVGLVEVENEQVVNDLVNHPNLAPYHYGVVHYDSPDERGIDVALIYSREHFEFLSSETFSVLLTDEEGERDYTRDILLVSGNLKGELVHVLVNHWPSRRNGAGETEDKRIAVAKRVREAISIIRLKDKDAKIIIMGDFNDDPISTSVKQHLVQDDFYNPMESLFDKGKGTLTYDEKWNLFDQIIFSNNWLDKTSGKFYFKHAEVFNKEWLKEFRGKFKGSPFRTYVGKWYKGGFSDHFPVYTYIKRKSNAK